MAPARGGTRSLDNSQQTGTLKSALEHTARLLPRDPAKAEAQAREILRSVPAHPQAQLFLAVALRAQGDAAGAAEILEALARSQPKTPAVQYEFGLALGDLGRGRDAVAALSRAVRLAPNHAQAWRALGDQFSLADDRDAADQAYAHHIKASVNDPQLLEAASALCENRLAVAERLLRPFLMEHPTDVAAIRMLAELGSRLGRYDEAEKLLARCLALAPGFEAARHNYATVLNRQNKPEQALEQIGELLARAPRNPGYRNLQAAALARLGETDRAAEVYASVLKDYPDQPHAWMSYGHTLKTLGEREKGIAAYRRAIAQKPGLGEAYWSLANLKTFRFGADEIAAMRAQLDGTNLSPDDRFHLEFALAKALEDAGDYAQSFARYEKANALRRESLPYHADQTSSFMKRLAATFSAEFFAARAGAGSQAPDPIFVVGLPRSGSTLIEQILSSHSAVEGTMELHDVGQIARQLGNWARTEGAPAYPEALGDLAHERFKALGEDYLARTRIHRRLGRPFFIDKMPNNFLHIGLIQLMLPHAKIIDARRHPLGCCLSCFKQHFARGQSFSYGLADIGRYYRDYVELMAHYDAALPGRVHRVFYERMVEDAPGEVRRLLDYCGLPFEEGCLRFYENDRAVRTASSEQVRMPIFADAVDHWQNFEPWLGPLKHALGPALTAYPAATVL
jgi:predicted Zn-dependent protease